MRTYCVQMDVAWEDKPANFLRAREMLRAVVPQRRSLVILPEMFATGFSMNVARIAEERAGETEIFLAALAREFAVTVIGAVVRRDGGGKGMNRALAVSPEGTLLADYAKVHPFTFGGEAEHFAPGREIGLFDWAGAKVMPAICYDLRFPELYRAGVRRGAEVMTVIANWPAKREAHWRALLMARAIENQCYVAGCNRAGSDPENVYHGGSLIVDPEGRIIAEAGARAEVISADLDFASLRAYRASFPALRDMRNAAPFPPDSV